MRIVMLVGLAGVGVARADDGVRTVADPPSSHHLVYAEAFGKAGAYGIGYEHTITRELALGAVASFVSVRGQQIATGSPYVHATLVKRRKHALFGELGAVLVHSRIPSPVSDWNGMSESGGGGVAAVGYEHASRHLVLRAQGSVLVGEGGVAPWGGLAIGVRP